MSIQTSKRVLAIAAHPDDIEILMSGTLLALQRQGYEIHYFNVANGCCGSTTLSKKEISSVRAQESQRACELLSAVYHESICDDLAIFYDQATLGRVAAVLRAVTPSIILTHALTDYMEDHTTTARLTKTAAFSRAMPNFPTIPSQPPISEPVALYHAQPYFHLDSFGKEFRPQLYVDVTEFIEQKRELLSCHASQKSWLDETQGLNSYLDSMRQLDRQAGLWSGQFHSAEGWTQHSHLGLGPEAWDPLQLALGEKGIRRHST